MSSSWSMVDVAVVVVVVVAVIVAVVVVVVGQLDRGACVTCDTVRSRRGYRCNDCRAGTATSNVYLQRLGPISLDTIDPQRNRTVFSSFFATVNSSSTGSFTGDRAQEEDNLAGDAIDPTRNSTVFSSFFTNVITFSKNFETTSEPQQEATRCSQLSSQLCWCGGVEGVKAGTQSRWQHQASSRTAVAALVLGSGRCCIRRRDRSMNSVSCTGPPAFAAGPSCALLAKSSATSHHEVCAVNGETRQLCHARPPR